MVQKIATALGVSMRSLFEPMDDVEGFIRIRCNPRYTDKEFSARLYELCNQISSISLY